MPMNPEIKAQWLEALRSGDYSQTTGTLEDSVGFCCLGVLCDLAVKAGIATRETKPLIDDSILISYKSGVESEWGTNRSGLPPEGVREWAGLPESNPKFEDADGVLHTLSFTNDNGATFAEIADIIEEQF